MNRRGLLKLIPAAAGAAALPSFSQAAQPIELSLHPAADQYCPLQEVTLAGASGGTVLVEDGNGNEYFRAAATGKPMPIKVGGALGRHSVKLLDSAGRQNGSLSFTVDCKTELHESSGDFEKLLTAATWTMMDWNQESPVNVIRYKDRIYQLFVNWIFDHTLTMKGMKYFWPELKDAVDFFAETQREDGMIWENCYPSTPEANYFDWKFSYGDFVRRLENGFRQLRRAPVESHVEQYFVEALYYTWKATGDGEWMKTRLDSAIRAIGYATSDPYRWSKKYRLMRRGFTIDTWDYTSDDQQKIGSDCVFVVYLDRSEFGVFFGDNTNLIVACRRLAEMLRAAARNREADDFEKLAEDIQSRLDKLAWNGEFYTHWIAENSNYRPDVGVDMARQVALSNASSLNRGLSHDKCVRILKTYEHIREEMPTTSPGEFYGIYPPFERDFTQNAPGKVWEYVNGGVLTFIAAELAHGAYEHGFEKYGSDILRRQKGVADRYRGYLPATLRGKAYEPPARTFQQLDFSAAANADRGSGGAGVPGWSGDPGPRLTDISAGKQEFQSVPFEVIPRDSNGGRNCLVLAQASPSSQEGTVAVAAKAESVYLLHAASGTGLAVGTFTIGYTDGSRHAQFVEQGRTVGSWWEPHDTKYNREGPRISDTMRIAWQQSAGGFPNVGVYVTGFANPHPEKEIQSLVFHAGLSKDTKWIILAATLSTGPVFFPPLDDLSSGIPDGWNAAVAWAILDGLAGVKDDGVAFSRTVLSPRWASADVNEARATVRYPASQGYCSYSYRRASAKDSVEVEFTGSAGEFEVRVLLPDNVRVQSATLDGKPYALAVETVESSQYAVVQVKRPGVHHAEFFLR